jgi:hypothetical protein
MSASDLAVNRSVRRILVKHWIDLGRVAVRSNKGRVVIRGWLQRIEGATSELTPAVVTAMMDEIKRLRDVSRLVGRFDNWICDSGRWVPHESEAAMLEKKVGGRSGGGSFDL